MLALVLLGALMVVVAAADDRRIGAGIGVVAIVCVVVSPALRVPLGVPLSAAGLMSAYVAALHDRFDGSDVVLFFGSLLTLLLAISALGFVDSDDRTRTWGVSRPFLAVETGPVAALTYPGSRGRRFVGEIGGFALIGLIGCAVALHDGSGWRFAVAAVGTVVVLLSVFLRAPFWAVICWAGTSVALVAAWGPTSWAAGAWIAFQSGVVFFYVRDAAWNHRRSCGRGPRCA